MFQWLKKKFLGRLGSYQSVVDTQINLYLREKKWYREKKRYSEATENEILDRLLLSRVRADSMFPGSSPEEQKLYYAALLQDDRKTLHDVCFHIVWYEFIVSRRDWVAKHLTPEQVMIFEIEVKNYISNQIEQRVPHE